MGMLSMGGITGIAGIVAMGGIVGSMGIVIGGVVGATAAGGAGGSGGWAALGVSTVSPSPEAYPSTTTTVPVSAAAMAASRRLSASDGVEVICGLSERLVWTPMLVIPFAKAVTAT
jgi:hypothetical protein